MNTNLFGSFNSPFGSNNNTSETFSPWNQNFTEQNKFSPINGTNTFYHSKMPEYPIPSPKIINTNEYVNNYSNGYTTGFDKGFNAGYLKATEEHKFNGYFQQGNGYFQQGNGYFQNMQSPDYTSGYDCGIRNYMNAINLINAYNSNKTPIAETNNRWKPKNKKEFNKKSKFHKNNNFTKKEQKINSNQNYSPNTDKDTPNNSAFSKSLSKKPILIIKKITKNSQNEFSKDASTEDIGSIFSNLLKTDGDGDDSRVNKVNYLEDSDDEIDNLVSIDDIKCSKDYIDIKKKEFNDIKIISLKDIILKDNINSIDDLITIGNYYEQNFFIHEKPTSDNTKKTETETENTKDNDEEFRIMESIIKTLGIPITPSTNIIINNKTKKKVLSSPIKNTSSSSNTPKINSNDKTVNSIDSNNSNDKSVDSNDKTIELYKINDCYFTINLEKVFKMKGHLIKLKKMIGLENIKNEIIDMILYYLMEFEKKNNNMLHMTLEGSPGCGKTKLAKIISKLLGAMGILDNDKIVYARRTDMIGQYLGQTGHKTQSVIDSALGGVLFIDEAYSLGNSKKDIYSKECLDILNQNLSDNKKKLVCIIAGYPEELENYFFSSNPGLTRRFPFRFKINNYTHTELLNIFINKINKLNWKLDSNTNLEEFFEKNILHFKYFGGDIDTFIQDIKYSHSRRVVCSHPSEFRIITKTDIKSAFDKFKNRRKNSNSDEWKGMYV